MSTLATLVTELIKQVQTNLHFSQLDLLRLQRKYLRNQTQIQPFYQKVEILAYFKKNYSTQNLDAKLYQTIIKILQVKPIRTQSGVATVTLLTKPWPCPGQCIFCPADVRMPKSYLANEPGAQRAELNFFDPYLQVMNRLHALKAMGHNLSKVEIIILGGTWESYLLEYRLWFVTQIFQALNDFSLDLDQSNEISQYYHQLNEQLKKQQEIYLSNQPAENEKNWQTWQNKVDQGEISYNELVNQCYLKNTREIKLKQWQKATWQQLKQQQYINQSAKTRNVGLVMETRPDLINEQSLTTLRRMGATKVQIGVQSVNDQILEMNKRGIDSESIALAFAWLRIFGFKIHAHFMANLYGADVSKDIEDYHRFVTHENYLPDEIKLYPCSLLQSAPLFDYYQKKLWQPYTQAQLLQVLTHNLQSTLEFIRITRMIRDFSAHDIIAGNKKTNFRQLVENELSKNKIKIKEIRQREIKNQIIQADDLILKEIHYQTSVSDEYFLQMVTAENKIAGFLRLSLPKKITRWQGINDYLGREVKAAMIREVHVYGVVSNLGEKGQSQHLGLGKKLIAQAKKIAQAHGWRQLRVISAIGLQLYYEKLGFRSDGLYQICDLKT